MEDMKEKDVQDMDISATEEEVKEQVENVEDPQLKEIETLKSQGYKLGIVTSKMKIATEKTLNEINIGHYFDYVISIEDVSAPKPNPEGVLKSIEFFKSSKEETLFIGDAVSDLLTANNAGVDCCLVSWNLRGRHKNVSPKFYIDSPTQLLEVILNGK